MRKYMKQYKISSAGSFALFSVFCVLCLSQSRNACAQMADSLWIRDTRTINSLPGDFLSNKGHKATLEFKERHVISLPGISTYATLFSLAQWADATGGKMHQLAFSDDGAFFRQGLVAAGGSWGSWQKLTMQDAVTGAVYASGAVLKPYSNAPSYIQFDATGITNGRNWEIGTAYGGVGLKKFYIYDNSASKSRLIIDENGYMGIGTDCPPEKLSVDGNIIARKIKVLQNTWCDYVFDASYKLPSLLSVESFIKQNKHLPDIPSAKEVEVNGISIGDNQALLLKKIEELTLYMIELKKENNMLDQKLKAQGKRVLALENKQRK